LVVELAIQGSRVFQTELTWKTLSSVMLLPKGVAEIAYSKLFGTAISLIPALIVLFVGAVCAPHVLGDILEEMVDEPGAWYFVSQVILFIHLATILSLYVKWGAVPLAFAAIYGGNMLMMIFASLFFRFQPPGQEILGLLAVVTIMICVGMHRVIGQRLKHLAAR
jgi:hypothetical protein